MPRRALWAGTLLVVGVMAAAFFISGVRDFFTAIPETIADWSMELRDRADALPDTEVAERSLRGESASLLLVVGDGESAAFALIAAGPREPPTVIVLPQGLLLNVPGFGEFRLADAMAFEGPALAALAVTNEFGVRIDRVALLPAGSFGSAFTDQVVVDLASPFFIDDGTTITRRLPAGPTEVSPETIEILLTESGGGDAFEWIQRQGAAWRTVLAEVAADPRAADRLLNDIAGPDAADLLITVAGDAETDVATVPVERAISTAGDQTLAPVADRVTGFVAERLGHLLIRPGTRPRIEILNGNGRIGSTRAVADILIPRGYRLIRTDNADSFDYEDTLVIAQGDDNEAVARDVVELLGRGLLFLEVRAPSGVVDVSIIVGTDVPTGEG
jgi:hypothetical protein